MMLWYSLKVINLTGHAYFTVSEGLKLIFHLKTKHLREEEAVDGEPMALTEDKVPHKRLSESVWKESSRSESPVQHDFTSLYRCF